MKCGIVISENDIGNMCGLAAEAEQAGWDGIFIADALSMDLPWFDPWIAMGAMAMKTERIRIGTMIAAVPRRRPWKMAREAVTIDQISKGRLILGVGLGAADFDGGFSKVGEPVDLKTRAELLDEGLDIMAGLWTGKPFSFKGEHYQVDKLKMLPATVQSPRVPIWVVGVWPKEKSMRRTIKWDGVIPQKYKGTPSDIPTADFYRPIKDYVAEHHPHPDRFDIIAGGVTPGRSKKRAIEKVRPFMEAGATWWTESDWSANMKKTLERIRQGPPRPE
ncbi:MAG TPA: LLM class flavin-dependent oxidoreductase [Blastocatellia bacterium]|nr:LLM class flavin-dependent oxidoreductase [Blastocatellia bacterium]